MKILTFILIATQVFGQGYNNEIIIEENGDIRIRNILSLDRYSNVGSDDKVLSNEMLGIYYDTRHKYSINNFLNFDIKEDISASLEYVYNKGMQPVDRLNLVVKSERFKNITHNGVLSFRLKKEFDYENFSYFDLEIIDDSTFLFYVHERKNLNVYEVKTENDNLKVSSLKSISNFRIDQLSYFNVLDFNRSKGLLSVLTNNQIITFNNSEIIKEDVSPNAILINNNHESKYLVDRSDWNSYLNGEISSESLKKKHLIK